VSRLAWLVLLLLSVGPAACGGPVQRVDLADPKAAPAAVEPRVLVVSLTGKLGTQELARCHRSLREADARGCSHVVFRLDTAGTQDDEDLQSLLDHLQSSKVATVAVLRGRITHGAAALALVCTKAFVLPNAQWGEVVKPEQEWSEMFASNPDEAMAQRLDGLREAMAARLARRDPKFTPDAEKLALAMVDPRVKIVLATVREGGIERQKVLTADEITALQAAGTKVFGDQALQSPLMLSAAQADEFRLATALSGLDLLAEALTVDPQTIGELTVNWAERMVGWLELLQPFLLVVGFVLLVVEMKTPGIGFAGLFGVIFLASPCSTATWSAWRRSPRSWCSSSGSPRSPSRSSCCPAPIVFGGLGFLFLVLALVLSRQSFVLPSNAVEEGCSSPTSAADAAVRLGAGARRLAVAHPAEAAVLQPGVPGAAVAGAERRRGWRWQWPRHRSGPDRAGRPHRHRRDRAASVGCHGDRRPTHRRGDRGRVRRRRHEGAGALRERQPRRRRGRRPGTGRQPRPGSRASAAASASCCCC
jgi:membrane-bound ClpP family serine protease